MDNLTTVTKKMQASRKLEIVGDLVRLMEADGIKLFNISVDTTECGIMTYDAKQLYTWIKARELYQGSPLHRTCILLGVTVL